ncbi:hypothetical protein NKH77_10270 [Streptomyces sp. M19]
MLAPLSPSGVGRLVRDALGDAADDGFCHECWALTGGNPAAVVQLTARARARDLGPGRHPPAVPVPASVPAAPRADHRAADRRAAGRRTGRASGGLGAGRSGSPGPSPSSAPTPPAARRARRGPRRRRGPRPPRTARRRGVLLPPRGRDCDQPLEYPDPSAATAVYRAIPGALRVALHGQAASVVLGAGLGPTAAARHLLETHPEQDPHVVRQLREAAEAHLRSGAPDAARRCLTRALREPPDGPERAAVLYERGAAPCSATPRPPSATCAPP